jgi:hypothetical protein
MQPAYLVCLRVLEDSDGYVHPNAHRLLHIIHGHESGAVSDWGNQLQFLSRDITDEFTRDVSVFLVRGLNVEERERSCKLQFFLDAAQIKRI